MPFAHTSSTPISGAGAEIIRFAWAKRLRSGEALPLTDHGGDVAAVLTELLRQTHWQRLLTIAAQRPLTEQDCMRLGALAFLHDLGKANRGFWARQFDGARVIGHTQETAPLLRTDLKDRPEVAPLMDLIDSWDCWDHFVAVMAHHGTPLKAYSALGGEAEQGNIRRMRALWAADDGYDPLAQLATLLREVRDRFPLAFMPGPALPDQPAFVALLGGIVTLADWLGSDVDLFPVAGPHHGLRDPMRSTHAPRAIATRGLGDCTMAAAGFADLFGYAPRGAQTVSDATDLGPIALIESETGSGKTEAALWRWLALCAAGEVDGLYFALPTRSAAVQLHGRINRMLARLTDGADTGIQCGVITTLPGDGPGRNMAEAVFQPGDEGRPVTTDDLLFGMASRGWTSWGVDRLFG